MNTASIIRRPKARNLALLGIWLLIGYQPADGQHGPSADESTVQLFIRQIESSDSNQKRRARYRTLPQIGPNDSSDVPLLIEAFGTRDRNVRSSLTNALKRIGPAAVPYLVDAVAHDDKATVRLGAITALGSIHGLPSASIPCLVRAMSDDAPSIRQAAVNSLPAFGKSADGAISKIARIALEDSEVQVRQTAVICLGRIRLKPGASVPCLIRALSDNSAGVRKAAASSLASFGRDSKPAVSALTQALDDGDDDVRTAAVRTLAKLGPVAVHAVPALLERLRAEDLESSRLATLALRQIEPLDENATSALLAATLDAPSHVRRHAIWVLGSIEEPSRQTISTLVQLLDDSDESVVHKTLLTLGELGSDAVDATDHIIETTKGDNRTIAAMAENTLRLVAPQRALELLGEPFDPVQAYLDDIKDFGVGKHDWPQLHGSRFRNNTPAGTQIPTTWNIGGFDRTTGEWDPSEAVNIKWVARLGSQTYGNPVIANGKVFVGTNNRAGYVKRYPAEVDLGCLLCFRESDGKFLWQHSSEKLPTGRVHDWPLQGICSSPVIEGDRLWFVTNRGEVVCLDTEGFYDEQDDGPVRNEEGTLFDVRRREDGTDNFGNAIAALQNGELTSFVREEFKRVGMELPEAVSMTTIEPNRRWRLVAKVGSTNRQFNCVVQGTRLRILKLITAEDQHEADVVWKFNMMEKLGVSQHNMATCSPTIWGDTLFICTSNGLDESHINIPSPEAPSFMAMDKNSGQVLWTDNSPGRNILHGQWSCPVVGVFDDVPQVIFPGGDGWLYSFRADRWDSGTPELLWKFDANPKASEWILGGRGTRNNLIAVPVIYDGLVYFAVGQDPEHGEGDGHLWCIDPTKRGDVSAELVVDADGNAMPHRRIKAIVDEPTEVIFRLYSQDAEGLTDGLGEGVIPEPIVNAFSKSGYRLPESTEIRSAEKNGNWLVSARIDGRNQQFRLRVGKTVIAERDTNHERVIANPNSAVVWHYDTFDRDGDGVLDFYEEFHRTISSPVIKNDILVIPDFSGLVHCLNAKTGIPYWTCDLFAACWGTPVIVEDKVYVGDEDGDVAILALSPDPSDFTQGETDIDSGDWLEPLHEMNMDSSIYPTPVVANNVLYIATKSCLFAIASQAE